MKDILDIALAVAHMDFPQCSPDRRADLTMLQSSVEKQPGGYAWIVFDQENNQHIIVAYNKDFQQLLNLTGQNPVVLGHISLPEHAIDILVNTLTDVLETSQRHSCIVQIPNQNHQMCTVQLSVSRYSTDHDALARFGVVAQDISEKRHVETVARHATELMRAMIDGVQEYAVFLLNAQQVIVSWNAGAARLTGKTGHDMVGHTVEILDTPAQSDHVDWVSLIKSTTLKTGPVTVSGWMVKRGGMFWGTATCRSLILQNTLRGYAIVIRDLSEKLASEAAIRESEARFRDFAESASDWFWETDSGLHINYLSETFQDRLKISPGFILGHAHYQFSDMHENADDWWEHLRALNAHKPFREFRYSITLPDGRVVQISDSGKPRFNEDGDFIGYRGASRDITQEVKVREAANTIANRFFSAMDTASEAIVLFDSRRRLVFWNHRTTLMFPQISRKLRAGLRLNTLLLYLANATDSGPKADPRGLRAIFENNNEAEISAEIRLQDGRYLRITQRKTPEDGTTFVLADTSEAVIREQKMRQGYKLEALGQLTGGVAHDFNNLLTVVRGNLEMIEPHVETDTRLRKRVDNALAAVNQGADLTARLLGFARQSPAESHVIELADHMTTLLPLLRQAVGTSAAFSQDIIDVGYVKVDPSQLDNALLNLCINARDAMPDGGALHLKINSVGSALTMPTDVDVVNNTQWMMISVSDTGSGMRNEIKERAFDPFFTTKEHGKGSGLGLSMVYGFAKRSQGFVAIETEVDVGTSVTIYLPVYQNGPRNVAPPSVTHQSVLGDKETILVIEDNEAARNVVVSMLEELGYMVNVAIDGPSGVSLFKTSPEIALVLSDFSMSGGMTGIEVARAIRMIKPGTAFIIMSGYTGVIPTLEAPELANIAVIPKPFTMLEISRVLREVLDQ